jgi:hypothetical protein
LAVVAWLAVDECFATNVDRSVDWMLSVCSKPLPRGGAMEHDTTLVAWPWVVGTHAWVEPTALGVLALKAAGHSRHPRTREAVRLLLDRQLPSGGCNYGNTRVLGQQLRPHLLPTGLAMLALNGEDKKDPRLVKSLAFLARRISRDTPVLSLCWALLGLAAHGHRPACADDWLARIAQCQRLAERPRIQTALTLLAALAEETPLARLCSPSRQVAEAT